MTTGTLSPENVPEDRKSGYRTLVCPDLVHSDWPKLRQQIIKRAQRRELSRLWPNWEAGGSPLLWGATIASKNKVSPITVAISQLAAGCTESAESLSQVDLQAEAENLIDGLAGPSPSLHCISEGLVWAYALPELLHLLPDSLWWKLLAEIQSLHNAARDLTDSSSLKRLLAAGELGLILNWKLPNLTSCEACGERGKKGVLDWIDQEEISIAEALREAGQYTRLTLASLLRSRHLLQRLFKKSLNRSRTASLAELTTWAAALTDSDGGVLFSDIDGTNAQRDVSQGGLLRSAAEDLKDDALRPVMDAVTGLAKSDGRLAWRIRLPETCWTSDTAQLAILLPEWDVKRGRVAIDYRNDLFRVQIHAGRPRLIDGLWEVSIHRDEQALKPVGPWQEICQYSDDDVHYIEFEQHWTDGVTLQRQFLVIRDDRCVLVADAVICKPSESSPSAVTRYAARLPIRESILSESESDTREIIHSQGKPRALCLPLSFPEWKTGPNSGNGKLEVDEEGALVLKMEGHSNLYAPLWFDFHRPRFRKPRTWRQLTVGQDLRIVEPHEAVAFRIQVGSDQWFVYRSLVDHTCRTALGKHLVADFYCGRFDRSDGSLEELIAVDDVDEDEPR